jgi:uncharacterized protein
LEIIKEVFDKKFYLPENIKILTNNKKVLFFDIETTGFNPKKSNIILIGMSYEENGKYVVEQIFANSTEDEKDMLYEFKKRLLRFDLIVTYNGKSFDVPFTNIRMIIKSIDYQIKQEHLDVICHVRPNKTHLGLTSCSLKSVEKLFKIEREDTINGEDSINLYYEYLNTRDETVKKKILLHNFEDVFYLPYVLKIFDKIEYSEHPERITSKQKRYLSNVLNRKRLQLNKDINSLSKFEAAKLIEHILKGSECEFVKYIEKV